MPNTNMKLPIDTTALSFATGAAPKPVVDFDTKQPKVENGEPMFSIELVVYADEGAQIITVKFLGTPAVGFKQGSPVRVTGLVATNWAMDSRSGMSFRAARVEPVSVSKAAA